MELNVIRLLAFVVIVGLVFWLMTVGEKRKRASDRAAVLGQLDPAAGQSAPTGGGKTVYVCPTCGMEHSAPGKCRFCRDKLERRAA